MAYQADRLSWGDALFLYLEREGMPLNIASVTEFEGDISLEPLRRFIASKIPLIPRYRQRVIAAPFNIGLPTWEFDPEFKVRNHVRQVNLKRGTRAELQALTGQILSKMMDRERPLWDLTLVRGLTGNRSAIVIRIHHCLADGIAGVGLMNILMDPSRQAPVLRRPRSRFRVAPRRDQQTLVLEGLISSWFQLVERILLSQVDVLNIGQKLLAGSGNGNMDQFAELLPELAAATQPLRFNTVCKGPQRVAWGKMSLRQIKSIRTTCGGTVNDVILSVVTSTIRRYLEAHGDPVKGRLLRMMVPVNVRGTNSTGDLGNRISLIPVTIPLDVRDPRKLICAVHQRTDFLKAAPVAELVSLAGALIGATLTPLQAFAGPIASQLPLTPFNLVCTSVPGLKTPLYLLGHKMLSWYPYVPVGGDMALNCAVLSYNGTTYFGFSADVHAAPDVKRLQTLLASSIGELRKLAGPAKKTRRSVRENTARVFAIKQRSAVPVPASPSGPAMHGIGVAAGV